MLAASICGSGADFKRSVSQIKHMFDTQNRRLIAETIFVYPEKTFHLRGLAEESSVSPSTTSRILEEFEEKGLVNIKRDLKMEIKAAQTQGFRDFKTSYNLWKLAETGLISQIEGEAVPEAIVLFGSYSRGEDNSESDIDVAVINGREAAIDLERFEQELKRKINLHTIEPEQADENFKETLANGIVLRGYLDI